MGSTFNLLRNWSTRAVSFLVSDESFSEAIFFFGEVNRLEMGFRIFDFHC
jgi:hypothetical protein